MPKKEQETNYCEKHKQEYYAYLNECPVCVGEKIIITKPKDQLQQFPNAHAGISQGNEYLNSEPYR